MRRLYSIPLSTNVERVTLAMGHKGLKAEVIEVPADDRSLVEKVSGQPLVPVLEEDGKVIADSTAILRHLEARYPDRPLFPADPARRAEVDLFIDWFNLSWKRLPNVMYTEMVREIPDSERIERHGAALTAYVDLFEGMLSGRDYLMGDEFSVADCIAFPFLKFPLLIPQDDPYLFHKILVDYQPMKGHPNLHAWIRRVDDHPRS